MNYRNISWQAAAVDCLPIRRNLACLILLVWSSTLFAQNPGNAKNPTGALSIGATHVLGFESAPNNATGKLSIEGGALQFQKTEGPATQVSIGSIQNVLLGVEDKQVGGTPMALGRAATPFGGGRVIGLFSHKMYDTVTLEYLDANGGFHGAIFQLNKGKGELLKNQLLASGAHFAKPEEQTTKQSSPEAKNDNK